MKYFLIILLTSISFNTNICCDKKLKSTLATVQQLDKAHQLIDHVLKEGPLTIKVDKHFPFAAYWEPATRTIGITPGENPIYSLLFELHNAASQSTYDYYNDLAVHKKISKEEYIRTFEYIEYQNIYETSALIEEGIRQGIFSKECRTDYHATFEEHYRDQQVAGHAAWHGDNYEMLAV